MGDSISHVYLQQGSLTYSVLNGSMLHHNKFLLYHYYFSVVLIKDLKLRPNDVRLENLELQLIRLILLMMRLTRPTIKRLNKGF